MFLSILFLVVIVIFVVALVIDGSVVFVYQYLGRGLMLLFG
jgi:hypothetical protein